MPRFTVTLRRNPSTGLPREALIGLRDAAEARLKAAGKVLSSYPRNASGLPPENIRTSAAYQRDKKASAEAFAELRYINGLLAKTKRNPRKHRRNPAMFLIVKAGVPQRLYYAGGGEWTRTQRNARVYASRGNAWDAANRLKRQTSKFIYVKAAGR